MFAVCTCGFAEVVKPLYDVLKNEKGDLYTQVTALSMHIHRLTHIRTNTCAGEELRRHQRESREQRADRPVVALSGSCIGRMLRYWHHSR